MLPGEPPFPEAENIHRARSIAAKLATSDLPILVTGEVGTGRRTMARQVAGSRRSVEGAVIAFSAFDGLPRALRERQRARVAVVVDHIHALEAREQIELAALVRDRQLLLVAVSKVGDGPLAGDLSALLDATQIVLPPLRDRESDATAWAGLFAARAAAEQGGTARTLSHEARHAVAAHAWPGNLSELDAVIRRAVVLGRSDVIEASDLGFGGQTLVVQTLAGAIEEFRTAYIEKVLAHFDGNRSQAARALNVDPRTVFRHLAKTKGEV